MKLNNVDGFSFDFTDAIAAFVFDEKDKSKSTYHGVAMKAVDIVVVLESAYLFIEIKNFDDPSAFDTRSFEDDDALKRKRDHFKWLKNYLKYKFRDSYLYRHAEQKVDKPIHYLCLLNLDNAMNTVMWKALNRELPVGIPSNRWLQKLAESCQVVNLEKWNHNFPKWPAAYVAE